MKEKEGKGKDMKTHTVKGNRRKLMERKEMKANEMKGKKRKWKLFPSIQFPKFWLYKMTGCVNLQPMPRVFCLIMVKAIKRIERK